MGNEERSSATSDEWHRGFRVKRALLACIPRRPCPRVIQTRCEHVWCRPLSIFCVFVRVCARRLHANSVTCLAEQTTTCADDSNVCPTSAKLKKTQRFELWGEGAFEKLHLEVKSVSAESA